MLRLTFLGANRQVTGSCYALDAAGLRVLVDCGLYQEREYQGRNWEPTPVDVPALAAVLLTHAHLDHCGLLPKLAREGFAGPVHATPPTIELARLVLEDAARIQAEDVAYKKKRHQREGRVGPHPYVPLYTEEDVAAIAARMRPLGYEAPLALGADVRACFHDAGHILGSAMVEVSAPARGGTRSVLFSGDLGQPAVPIVRDPARVRRADYVVIESTYGNRDHQHRSEIDDQLADAVRTAVGRGGSVLIPTFAIERAQELMLHLAELLDAGRIPRVPVYLDSPMAVDATEIFARHRDYMDAPTRAAFAGGRFTRARGWLSLVRTREDSKEIDAARGSAIVLAGSGMCTGGRIKHHLAQQIERPETLVLFSGYQARGTLGREILDGRKEVRILGRMRVVRAEVRQIWGLSAHAGRDDLLAWLGGFEAPPRRLFVTHGEEEASLAFAEAVRSALGWDVRVPVYGESLELD